MCFTFLFQINQTERLWTDFRKFWRLFYCLCFVILTEVLMFFPRSRLQRKVWNCWMICGLAWRKLKLRNPKRRKQVSWSGSMTLMDLMKYGHCFGFCYWFVIHSSWCVFVHCANCVCVTDGKGSDEEPHWVEVVVEILLSLLSQPSRLIRCVCKAVFSRICPHLTQAALSSILNVRDYWPMNSAFLLLYYILL